MCKASVAVTSTGGCAGVLAIQEIILGSTPVPKGSTTRTSVPVPGAATDVPRSRVEEGPPPTYDLSDERNAP